MGGWACEKLKISVGSNYQQYFVTVIQKKQRGILCFFASNFLPLVFGTKFGHFYMFLVFSRGQFSLS